MAGLDGGADRGGEHVVRYFGCWMEYDHLYIQLELCDTTLSAAFAACVASRARESMDAETSAGDVPEEPRGDGAKTKTKTKTFGQKEIEKVLRHVASALAFAHARNVAHLDVKPDNVLVRDGVYKLADWGAPRPWTASGTWENRPASARRSRGWFPSPSPWRRATRGTSRPSCYAATSRRFGKTRTTRRGRVSANEPRERSPYSFVGLDRADVFSLGATAYELASGAPLPASGEAHQALRNGLAGLAFESSRRSVLRDRLTAGPRRRDLRKRKAKRRSRPRSSLWSRRWWPRPRARGRAPPRCSPRRRRWTLPIRRRSPGWRGGEPGRDRDVLARGPRLHREGLACGEAGAGRHALQAGLQRVRRGGEVRAGESGRDGRRRAKKTLKKFKFGLSFFSTIAAQSLTRRSVDFSDLQTDPRVRRVRRAWDGTRSFSTGAHLANAAVDSPTRHGGDVLRAVQRGALRRNAAASSRRSRNVRGRPRRRPRRGCVRRRRARCGRSAEIARVPDPPRRPRSRCGRHADARYPPGGGRVRLRASLRPAADG